MGVQSCKDLEDMRNKQKPKKWVSRTSVMGVEASRQLQAAGDHKIEPGLGSVSVTPKQVRKFTRRSFGTYFWLFQLEGRRSFTPNVASLVHAIGCPKATFQVS